MSEKTLNSMNPTNLISYVFPLVSMETWPHLPHQRAAN